MLFLSHYTNKLDKKGRVSVPASFRAVLAHEAFAGVIVYPSFVHPCIDACGMHRMERVHEGIEALDPYGSEREALAVAILGSALPLPFDSEGRIMLPDALIAHAHLQESVVLVGKGSTFALWDAQHFADHQREARATAATHRGLLRVTP